MKEEEEERQVSGSHMEKGHMLHNKWLRRLTVSKAGMSPRELLTVCQALFSVLGCRKVMGFTS